MKKLISKKNLILAFVVVALLAMAVNFFLCRVLGKYDTAEIDSIWLKQDGSWVDITDSVSDETEQEIFRVLNNSFGIRVRFINGYLGDKLDDLYN